VPVQSLRHKFPQVSLGGQSSPLLPRIYTQNLTSGRDSDVGELVDTQQYPANLSHMRSSGSIASTAHLPPNQELKNCSPTRIPPAPFNLALNLSQHHRRLSTLTLCVLHRNCACFEQLHRVCEHRVQPPSLCKPTRCGTNACRSS